MHLLLYLYYTRVLLSYSWSPSTQEHPSILLSDKERKENAMLNNQYYVSSKSTTTTYYYHLPQPHHSLWLFSNAIGR
ncbi:hypothetical protein B0T17DRAFT_538092 [Bombardia bombarda]|uniref:Secreted protein n=1 Tax=Bombardia bombarda TaxID=252184 RepID=A0AA40BYF7_9PEZI|nr:hypothetical protein B0T17DRAFT_538092 [Bombardia bombarda]